MGGMSGFVEGMMKSLGPGLEAARAQRQKERDFAHSTAWRAVTELAPDPKDPNDKGSKQYQDALKNFTETYGDKGPKIAQLLGPIFGKIRQAHQQGQGKQQTGPIRPPAASKQDIAAEGAMGPQAAAENAPTAQSGPMPSPAGMMQQQPSRLEKSQSKYDTLARGVRAGEEASQSREDARKRQSKVFDTNEQIRARKEEYDYSSKMGTAEKQKLEAEKAAKQKEEDANFEKEVFSYAKTLPPDQQKTYLEAYHNKKFLGSAKPVDPPAPSQTNIHVKLKSNGEWVPALESKDGTISGLDKKPIDAANIADINKTGAAPEKFTGELRTRLDAGKILSTSKDPIERKAAEETLKNLAVKQQATEIRVINEQSMGNSISDEDLMTLAKSEALTDQKPSFAFRDGKTKNRYASMVAQAKRDMGGPEAAALRRAEQKASTGNLVHLNKIKGELEAGKSATDTEIDRAISLAQNIPSSRFKAFNNASQFLSANLSSDPDLAKFREALLAARSRYNSMITSLRGGGAATNQVRTETAEEVVNRFMPRGALVAALEEMKVGTGNVVKGIDSAINSTRREMSGKSVAPPAGGSTPPTITTESEYNALKSGDLYITDGVTKKKK